MTDKLCLADTNAQPQKVGKGSQLTINTIEKLVRQPGRPLWRQLRDDLHHRIVGGEFAANAKLPIEQELCRIYGVSRTAVREALGDLVADRIIYRVQGSGAYVSPHKEESNIGTTVGFSSEIIAKGQRLTSEILEQITIDPNDIERDMLEIKGDEPIVRIRRIISVNGVPRILVQSAIPDRLAPGLEAANLKDKSLYEVIRRRYGLIPKKAERWIDAVAADTKQAKSLDVAVGHPLLAIESKVLLESGEPVEYYLAYYRSDEARLHMTGMQER